MDPRTDPSQSRRAWHRLAAAVPAGTVVALLAWLSPPGAASASATAAVLSPDCIPSPFSCTFNYTGGPQLLLIPAGMSAITVIADGAIGGTGSQGPGGYGGEAKATFAVTPGQAIEVVVGGEGAPYYTSGIGGFNGGGDAGRGALGKVYTGIDGGGGGGASDVRFGACASTLNCGPADRVLVAGGGGGSVGGNSAVQGGFGGHPSGGVGATYSGGGQAGGGGGGGSQANGGAGGGGDPNGACAGQLAADGGAGGTLAQDRGGKGGGGGVIYAGTDSSNGGNGGGGGGGGYWGGGGGGGGCGYRDLSGAGGGGSSYGPPGATFTNNTWPEDGQVTIIDSTPRDAPTIGHAIPGDSAARVTFTPPTAGAPVTSYTATAMDRTDPDRGGQTATGPGSPLTVTGLTNGDSYAFTVTATTSEGISPPSAASVPVTPNPLVYVANTTGDTVTEYANGVTGNAEPFATLSVPGGPVALTLDPAGDLWVTEFNGSVAEYAKGAAGGAQPVRTIKGGNTGLAYPTGVAVDAAGNVWVTNTVPFPCCDPGAVFKYAAGASGNIKPVTTIKGSDISSPYGVAVDPAGHVWVSNSNFTNHADRGWVSEYAVGANGAAQLIATIKGDNTDIYNPQAVVLDQDGNVWVSNLSYGGNGSVTEYAAGATGDVHPTTKISEPDLYPYGVAMDSTGHVFVVNNPIPGTAAVAEYAKSATGPPSLTAKIQGNGTGLDLPFGIAVAGAAPGHGGAPLRISHIAAWAGRHRHAIAGVAFTDHPAGRLSQYSGTIAWGDGTATAIPRQYFIKLPKLFGGGFAAGDRHTYARHGTYTITITIRDSDGASAAKSTTLKVPGTGTGGRVVLKAWSHLAGLASP